MMAIFSGTILIPEQRRHVPVMFMIKSWFLVCFIIKFSIISNRFLQLDLGTLSVVPPSMLWLNAGMSRYIFK